MLWSLQAIMLVLGCDTLGRWGTLPALYSLSLGVFFLGVFPLLPLASSSSSYCAQSFSLHLPEPSGMHTETMKNWLRSSKRRLISGLIRHLHHFCLEVPIIVVNKVLGYEERQIPGKS